MANKKVTVIGSTGSGKTCYLAGMYSLMSVGVKNFNVVAVDDSQNFNLIRLWSGMDKGSNRTMPAPSDQKDPYTFNLSHCFIPICDFDWLDYAGAALLDPSMGLIDEINESIHSSSCLLVLVDGTFFNVNTTTPEEYRSAVLRNLKNPGLSAEISRLSSLASKGIHLPPIIIVITKSDLIPQERASQLEDILFEAFGSIFGKDSNAGKGSNPDRVVMIVAVSLGVGFADGSDMDPRNFEQPIGYAVLAILCNHIAPLYIRAIHENQGEIKKHTNLLTKWWYSGEIAAANQNLAELKELADKISHDVFRLLDLFPEKKNVYVNGNRKDIHGYFRDVLRSLFSV
ncbi:MAG: hypothetical protein FWD64_05350 [Acidobacteriaceae bacterium]|nr:hypothetical protein [Acidobacteriaceae bacterium]